MGNLEDYCISSNGYDLLEGYTTKLYGERGRYRHVLEWYLSDEFFWSVNRTPKSIDDIPEYPFESIRFQIEREEHWAKVCESMLEKYQELFDAGQLTDDDYLEIAGLLGLYAGRGAWNETLLPYSVDLFVSSEEEADGLDRQVQRHPEIVRLMVDTILDGVRKRQVFRFGNRWVVSLGYARNYYRGENAYYGTSKPSMYRSVSDDPAEAALDRLVAYIRMCEFSIWLQSLSFVKEWPHGDVFHGAIAQHYGISTNALDMTSDLKVALFFACCKFDDGSWRPLRECEYAEADSREEVARLGGDSRYGIIHCSPANVIHISMAANIDELHLTSVSPIGYQPFMRCSNQSGYLIEAGNPYDVFQDPTFAEWKFKLTPEICEWIYQEMDGGRKIYPEEPYGVDKVVKRIKDATKFSEQAFKTALKCTQFPYPEQEARTMLQTRGIEIADTVEWCSDEHRALLEREYMNSYETRYNESAPVYWRPRFAM